MLLENYIPPKHTFTTQQPTFLFFSSYNSCLKKKNTHIYKNTHKHAHPPHSHPFLSSSPPYSYCITPREKEEMERECGGGNVWGEGGLCVWGRGSTRRSRRNEDAVCAVDSTNSVPT